MGFLKQPLRWGILFGIGIPVFLLGILLLIFDLQGKDIKAAALPSLAALCALPNLFFFFRALRKNKDTQAYGVLLSTILWALFTFGIKLFG